jgi:hypothetical protein
MPFVTGNSLYAEGPAPRKPNQMMTLKAIAAVAIVMTAIVALRKLGAGEDDRSKMAPL